MLTLQSNEPVTNFKQLKKKDMNFLAFQKAYEDYANVLHDYTVSKTVDRDVLKEQFSTVLCSFVKKEHFYQVMIEFLGLNWVIEDIKTQWESMFKTHLNEFTFPENTDYTDTIIQRVKDCYKLK